MNSTHFLAVPTHRLKNEVTESLQSFTGVDPYLEVDYTENSSLIRLPNAQQNLIHLIAHDEPLLGLNITIKCGWDSTHGSFVVDSSSYSFHPYANPKHDPLFRVEYERSLGADLPASHFHVHAHRDEFTHALGHAGWGNRRARKRSTRAFAKTPRIAEYHFPAGGSTFRPALEDVLESVRVEFGVDVTPTWQPHLKKARERWKTEQTAWATREYPEAALGVLHHEFGLPIPPGWQPPPQQKTANTPA